jgi:hypothetical protein
MDATYLKENVGNVLSLALASAVTVKPEDPVEFIAKYLIKHVQNQQRLIEV